MVHPHRSLNAVVVWELVYITVAVSFKFVVKFSVRLPVFVAVAQAIFTLSIELCLSKV